MKDKDAFFFFVIKCTNETHTDARTHTHTQRERENMRAHTHTDTYTHTHTLTDISYKKIVLNTLKKTRTHADTQREHAVSFDWMRTVLMDSFVDPPIGIKWPSESDLDDKVDALAVCWWHLSLHLEEDTKSVQASQYYLSKPLYCWAIGCLTRCLTQSELLALKKYLIKTLFKLIKKCIKLIKSESKDIYNFT